MIMAMDVWAHVKRKMIQERITHYSDREVKDICHALENSPDILSKLEEGIGTGKNIAADYLFGIINEAPPAYEGMKYQSADPDIDTDYADHHRDKVFTYLADKYGRDHVARLGTVSFLRERAFAKEVGAGLGIPINKFESVMQSVEKFEGNTSIADVLKNTPQGKDLLREFPDVAIASRIEGHPRHASTHSAGVIITKKPISEYTTVDSRNNTAHLDKNDAEDLGILKVDALGLKQLSIFEDCLKLIGKSHDWLNNVPLDDMNAFNVLNNKMFSGVFQYNGSAMQQVSSSFRVSSFSDMVATTCLARPGPLGSGGTDMWLDVRNGKRQMKKYHPLFQPVMDLTGGVIMTQEQVMQLGRLAGMSWPRVTQLRKVVQYFGGAAGMEAFREEFVSGTGERGVPTQEANLMWDDILTYGGYAFNVAHAIAYSMISYHCCYLKAYHPNEYAAAMLNHEAKPERQREMLRELRDEGVSYQPVDPETSGMKWMVTKNGLVGPITNIKGMGYKTALAYVAARNNGTEIPKRATTLLREAKTSLDSLTPISDQIKKHHPDLKAINIFSEPTEVISLGDQAQKNVLLFLRTLKATPRPDEKFGNTKITFLMEDDTGEIKVFSGGKNYQNIGKKIMDAGRIGKTLWAVKGSIPQGGGIVFADMVRFLGEFDA